MKAKQDYLPKEKLDKYLNVNPSSSLSSLVPRGMTEDELTMELTDKFTSVSSSSASGIENMLWIGCYLSKIYYIDIDEIPGFFLFLNLISSSGEVKSYMYLSRMKASVSSWLLTSQPIILEHLKRIRLY